MHDRGIIAVKTKIIVLVSLIIVITVAFSGCTFTIKSPEKLMSPPKLTGDYQSLQDSFLKTIDEEVDFVTPVNGEHKSAFIIDDFDSDGVEDAIVFYSSKEGEEKVNIGVFKKEENDNWLYVKKIPGAGNSVDCVVIEDMNGDKIKEVTVGWNIFTSNKQLTVYEPVVKNSNESFEEMGSYQYNLVTTVDVNSDGKKELFFVYLDANNSVPSAVACVIGIDKNNKLETISRASVDGNISGYEAIYVDSEEKNTVILVDAFKNEHDMITEVLVWDPEESKLSAPLFDVETQTTTATWRNKRQNVKDIDNDGHYEIPVGVEIVGSTYVINGELQDECLYYTRWSEFNGSKLKPQKYVIENDAEGYELDIPSSWVGKITVNRLDSQLYFYRWNASSEEHLGKQLFSLVSHAKGTQKISGYERLADFGSKSFEYSITQDGKDFGVVDQKIKDGFNITDTAREGKDNE